MVKELPLVKWVVEILQEEQRKLDQEDEQDPFDADSQTPTICLEVLDDSSGGKKSYSSW